SDGAADPLLGFRREEKSTGSGDTTATPAGPTGPGSGRRGKNREERERAGDVSGLPSGGAGSQADERIKVLFAPNAVLEGHSVGVVDGDVSLVFTDDPPFVVSTHEPFGDAMEIEFAGAHLRPGF